MYPKYFGLTESGFSITPDPQYLFLSDQHREALVHLQFGAGEGGGFVLLTGEVGTGKTTVCRAFLEQRPERVDLALIFNPALNSRELLQAVCSEFRIPVALEASSTRQLVSALNGYLLRAHAAGRLPLLMIDEAQNLSPEVLEQVRLLTNLETDKHKLLQIFLVGQPELREMLGQRGLRQLAQRITARYHLGPLKRRETRDYVQHRLRVAGAQRELFTGAALRLVHRKTGGVPRLINILCERALLGAYATGREKVTSPIVARAARELGGNSDRTPARPAGWVRARNWALAAFAGLSLGFAGYWLGSAGSWTPVTAFSRPASAPAEAGSISPIDASAQAPSGVDLVAHAAESAPLPQTEPGPAPASETAASAAAVVGLARPAQFQEPKVATVEPETARPPVAAPPAADSERPESADPEWRAFAAETLGVPVAGRKLAMQRLLAHWGIAFSERDRRDPCEAAEADLAACLVSQGGWERLLGFDRPALLRMEIGSSRALFVTVIGFRGDAVLVDLGDREEFVPRAQLDRHWSGEFTLLWRMPPGGERLVSDRASSRSREWLAEQLGPLVGNAQGTGLGALTMSFQEQQGLQVDGVAGPETMIRLNSLSKRSGVPQLRRGGRRLVVYSRSAEEVPAGARTRPGAGSAGGHVDGDAWGGGPGPPRLGLCIPGIGGRSHNDFPVWARTRAVFGAFRGFRLGPRRGVECARGCRSSAAGVRVAAGLGAAACGGREQRPGAGGKLRGRRFAGPGPVRSRTGSRSGLSPRPKRWPRSASHRRERIPDPSGAPRRAWRKPGRAALSRRWKRRGCRRHREQLRRPVPVCRGCRSPPRSAPRQRLRSRRLRTSSPRRHPGRWWVRRRRGRRRNGGCPSWPRPWSAGSRPRRLRWRPWTRVWVEHRFGRLGNCPRVPVNCLPRCFGGCPKRGCWCMSMWSSRRVDS